MEYGTGHIPGARILSTEECEELRAALRDPDFVARMLADVARASQVEVDNPVRREVRPRRGTDEG